MTRFDKIIMPWQGFRSVVQTMRWEEMMQDDSDGKLAEIEEDIERIRDLLSEWSGDIS